MKSKLNNIFRGITISYLIILGACVLYLAGHFILAYLVPITPLTQVAPAAVAAPLPREMSCEMSCETPQETPQEPQESPKSPQSNLSALDSPTPAPTAPALPLPFPSAPDGPTLAPAAPVLPLPPPGVLEVPVEVIVEQAKPYCRSCPYQRQRRFR